MEDRQEISGALVIDWLAEHGDYVELWQIALEAGLDDDKPDLVSDRVVHGLEAALQSGELIAGRVYGGPGPFEPYDEPVESILARIRAAIEDGRLGTDSDIWFDSPRVPGTPRTRGSRQRSDSHQFDDGLVHD